MNGPIALVTGATGFVGSHVARLLLAEGYEVRVLARPGSDRRNIPVSPGIRVVEGDLREPASLDLAVEDLRVDPVVFEKKLVPTILKFLTGSSTTFTEPPVPVAVNDVSVAGFQARTRIR